LNYLYKVVDSSLKSSAMKWSMVFIHLSAVKGRWYQTNCSNV